MLPSKFVDVSRFLFAKLKECCDLVKIGFYVVKAHGKRGDYEYEEVCMRFPKELHELLRSLRDHKIEIRATREGNITHIMLIDKGPL